jgi:hypothetical protein
MRPPSRGPQQLRLDWGVFTPEPARAKPLRVREAGPVVCPGCGCTPGVPCAIALDGGGAAACVAGGMFGRKLCSGCKP